MKIRRVLVSLVSCAVLFSTVLQPALPVAAEAVSAEQETEYVETEDYSDYVNMYIGTKYDSSIHKGNREYGGTMVMVTSPFGMTNFAPQTRENAIGSMSNRYEDTSIGGFIATHQPAVWMGDYGYVTMMPQIGDEIKTKFNDRKLSFSKEDQVSTPYYYSVKMDAKNGKDISVRMTATERCAIYDFQFPEDEIQNMYVEASRSGDEGNIVIDTEKQQIRGYNTDNMSSHLNDNPPKNLRGYFVIQFDKPFTATGTSQNYTVTKDSKEVTANAAGGYVTFDNPNNEPVQVKIGTSFISLEQAEANLETEIPGWDFEQTEQNLKSIWNEKLGTIEIEGASEDERTIFYTALYHAMLYPRIFSEYGRYYSPFDGEIHEGESYTDYSIWDTFRAENALLTLVAPERIDGMVQSLLQNYQEGGYMPKWNNPYYTNIMIGTHADSIVAEAIAKGFEGFDYDLAYSAVLKDALVPPEGDLNCRWADRQTGVPYEARAGLTYYKALGYVPDDKTNESGSRTLEGAYDDWCVAQVAKAVGKEEDYKFFINRSQNYKNLYNKEQQKMMGRNLDGSWVTGSWTEGSPDNYNWCVLQDFGGYVQLMGEEVYNQKLDNYFASGKNRHDNEPSHHYAYLYDYSGRPWKTQEMVRDILKKNYRADELGLMGNDDCGQMSSWYVFSAMGFYPVTPASGEYMIGSPIFDKVTIHNVNGEDFVIDAGNNPDENIYIESAMLNGEALNDPVLSHSDITAGGTLHFEMSASPTEWAENYRREALPTYENVQNPEEDYVPYIGDSTVQIYENNLALEAEASADTYQKVNDGGPADTMNDGNYNTGYVSGQNCTFPQNLTYTWDSPRSFNKICIYSNYGKRQGIKNFDLQVTYDGETWENIVTSQDIAWNSNNNNAEKYELTFDAVSGASGLRVKVNSAGMTWGHFAVRELEVYNTRGYVDLSSVQDVYVLTNPLVNVLESIQYEGYELVEGKDYSRDEKNANLIILKADFLKTLPRDQVCNIEFQYNVGKDPVLTLNVKDSQSASVLKTNIAPFASVTASSEDGSVRDGGTADTLIDGDKNRGWCTPTNVVFPQELIFQWDEAKSFDEIRMYGNYASKQAPSNIDIQVLETVNGQWKTVVKDYDLSWTSSVEAAEEKDILLPEIRSVYGVKIIINKCPAVWGRAAVREIEIMTDTYDVTKDREKDLLYDLELNGCQLTEIKNGDRVLEQNRDYAIEESRLVIKSSFLKTLKEETEVFELMFQKGLPQYITVYTHGYLDNPSGEIIRASLEKLHDTWAAEDLSVYTKESADALEKALGAAEAVLADAGASQKELDQAVSDLVKAIGGLEYGVQKLHLEVAIEAAEKILALGKNYEDIEGLTKAVEDGKAVLSDETATQEAVDSAAYAVLDELFQMAKTADISSLESLIEAAKGLLDGKYTSDSLENLKDAIDAAEAVVADQNRGDSDISDAYANLIDAIIGLKLKGNKAALGAMLLKANEVLKDADAYVAETIEGLAEVTAEAQKVYDNEDALQSEVNEAVKTLTLKVAEARLLGDVDGDGDVTTADSAAVLRSAAELDTLSADSAASADVNGDGAANTSDAVLILQYAAEEIAAF